MSRKPMENLFTAAFSRARSAVKSWALRLSRVKTTAARSDSPNPSITSRAMSRAVFSALGDDWSVESSRISRNSRRSWTSVLTRTSGATSRCHDAMGDSTSRRSTASNTEICCGLPSSRMVKSDGLNPRTGRLSRSRTDTSRWTTSTDDLNWGRGGDASGTGGWPGRRGTWAPSATARTRAVTKTVTNARIDGNRFGRAGARRLTRA